ncbi:hypothetical protein [Idiomarina piscisalsi]|uniref:Uncharacterized protein n=1 Tax=Idiomarina piscisalsi TaxID=1096243 RepID=A0A432YSP2_9GAMM|nr:hypothetical protein [Idiomarina piscisalsi]RUO64549.1 hypothetical protein CWI73_07610 [Idiomarina piscisalsi]
MGLINRVAISNMLNFYGDGKRKKWSPRFRYECLDFRGQSTAVNLTNGGGKTTLAEAMLAVLSRDHTLVSHTKKKFSPKSVGTWSHIQVELIRPLANTGQSDFITAEGNEVNGEHWVFGMYGYLGDQGVNYYYYKGRLEELPIGTDDGKQRTLLSNEEFVQNRKALPGLVMSPHEDEWEEALALKVNLPQSTIRQMTDFQKRGGQDKSALLYEIKTRPGQSYAEVFFYKVLAPAIMEGIMDREGEEGEVSLEDSVERSVFSTVKAKQDTATKRAETDELESGVEQLTKVMSVANEVEEKQREYDRHLAKIQRDVQVLSELVGKGRLLGVPKSSLPEGLVGDVAKHLVIEPGRSEVRVLDRGLAILLDKQTRHVNEQAQRNGIEGGESSQVIDIPCDFKLHDGLHGGRRKGESYSIEAAKALLKAASSMGHDLTNETAINLLEDAVYWFDNSADTNPYRLLYIEQEADLKQQKRDERNLDSELDRLRQEQLRLQQQQTRMETNEGLYADLVESGLFSEEELKAPKETAGIVREKLITARKAMSDFSILEAQLNEHYGAWKAYVAEYGKECVPVETLEQKKAEKNRLSESMHAISSNLKECTADLSKKQEKLIEAQGEHDKASQTLERLSEHRTAYKHFIERFGNISPEGKEDKLRADLNTNQTRLSTLQQQQESYQEGVSALHRFRETVSEIVSPEQWLKNISTRRAEIAIELNDSEMLLKNLCKQRETLENERIAANASTCSALDYLSEKNISYQVLHHVIDELGLKYERKREVLAVFSALLFAPVFPTEHEAKQAAEALSDFDAQVPVFLYRSLIEYCQSAPIEHADNNELLVGTTAGIVTRPVSCLLDPLLVEREKESLDTRINTVKITIETLQSESTSIGDESESVVLARRALRTIQDNEIKKLETVNQELEKCQSKVEELRQHTSPQVIAIIRSADSYAKLGGEKEDTTLQKRLVELSADIQTYELQISERQNQQSKLEEQISTLSEKIERVLPNDLAIMLNSAGSFYEKGGPEFMANCDTRRRDLLQEATKAENRNAYNKHFDGAQNYLDSISADQVNNLSQQLGEISRGIEETQRKRDAARIERDKLSESVPQVRNAMESIDKLVLLALKRYRKVAKLSADATNKSDRDINEDPLIEQCEKLLHANVNDEPETVRIIADALSGELEEIDIDRKASGLARAKDELEKKGKAFVDLAKDVIKSPTGLKPVEVQILKEINGVVDIPKVRTLYEGILEQLSRSKELLHQYESSERESRQLVSSRLAHLIEYAALDLGILRSVVGSNRGKHTSYFNVEAEVLDRTGIQRLMDGIVEEIDILERQRRELEKQRTRSEDTEDYHESLRSLIRKKLYQTIFSKPTITYVNTSIRGAGDEHEFNENLSEGQKAALSLMWAIRLAEFAIEREAKRLSSRRSQQKARDMSVNIMLIDGLFSNLSNRELIDSSMAGIESTRGSFQLIGLIHNPHYQNDFNKFPVFIIGKNEGNGKTGDSGKGWVSFRECTSDEPALRTAQIRRVPPSQVVR